MRQENTGPVSVIALRADGYSSDGKSLIISLITKYSAAERKYSMPIECFRDLIIDLRRLNADAGSTLSEPDAAQNPLHNLNHLTIAA